MVNFKGKEFFTADMGNRDVGEKKRKPVSVDQQNQLRRGFDPLPEGERPKVQGENPYLQMEVRWASFDGMLRGYLGRPATEKEAQAARSAMTAKEVSDFPRMSKVDVLTLAYDVASRLGWKKAEEEGRESAA